MADWIVNIDGQEYPARSREMVMEWFRAGRITLGSMIYHPERMAWITLNDYATEFAPHVILTTTPSIQGWNIRAYLGVQSGEHLTHALKFKDPLKDMLEVRQTATDLLCRRAVLCGGNAVVGLKYDYFQFTELLLCVSIIGTVVFAEPGV